ncbi:MAG TPA: hypothetical protein VNT79_09170, partial [Phycisphaerae bacterium]|nr:hypothetical protein [Phycisphaerae bacterium]
AATRVIAPVLGVGGQGGYQVARRAGTEAISNFVGTTSGELIRGEDLLSAGGTGLRSAALSLPGTVAGSRFAGRPGLQTAVEMGTDTLVTTGDVLAQGGGASDVAQSLAVNFATRGVLHQGKGFQQQQQRRFESGQEFGRSARSRVQSGVNQVRSFSAAAGIGAARVDPTRLSGFGGTGVPGTTIVQQSAARPAAVEPSESVTQPVATVAQPVSAQQTIATTQPASTVAHPVTTQPAVAVGSTVQAHAQSVVESSGAGGRMAASPRITPEITAAEQMGFVQPGTHQGASASAQTPKSMTTGIRADLGETTAYNARLARGEIGLERPQGSNVTGPDYITAQRDPDGTIWINVGDAKSRVSETSRFGRTKSSLPQTWSNAVSDALSPTRLNLGDPALEQAIRTAWLQGRVRIRQDNVDFSPSGQGRETLDAR